MHTAVRGRTTMVLDRRFFWEGMDGMKQALEHRRMSSLMTPRWILTTLLVMAAVAVMVRLGFWQLDRLGERRAFNARVEAQIHAPVLDLNRDIPLQALSGMEYRPAVARGVYDPPHEIVLRNQVSDGLPGYHLLTPLRIAGSDQSVLVDRGFIPLENGKTPARAQYVQTGTIEVKGVLRLGHVPRFFGAPDPPLAPGETRLDAWNAINLARIQAQTPYALLPVYLQAAPDPAQAGGPVASNDPPDLTDGPHLGYAVQWFSFAAVLALGYPFFVRKQLRSH